MTLIEVDNSGPPTKKIKSGEDFIKMIDECYDIQFDKGEKSDAQIKKLESGLKQIREIVEQAVNSQDVSFGATRSSSKITWGKCVSLMLEVGSPSENLNSIKLLTGRLSPGAGLL